MPNPLRYRAKPIRFFILTIFFAELLWLTSCTPQKRTVITPHEESITKAVATAKIERGITEESLKCITCHEERGIAHGWIADWEGSMHARKGVGCEACHVNLALEPEIKESNELKYFSTGGSNCEDKRVHRHVIAGNCGKCHIKQYDEFMKSRHSIGWQRMLECGQYLTLSKDIYSTKCEQCHNIQFKCDSCHTRHTFSTLEAKTPEACRTCHTGPDQPYYDIYTSSKHGAVYIASQAGILKESQDVHALRSPVCVTCHMPLGTHDISFGLAYAPVGGELSYINRNGITLDEIELTKRRNDTLSICNTCHSPTFAKKTLTAADVVHKDANNIVNEAKSIIFGLEKEDIIYLPNNKLIDIPFLNHAIILGNLPLYNSKLKIEYLLYKLRCNTTVITKGAYHMNPNYTYLYGWAELQKDLSEMKEEAKKLREEAEFKRKLGIKLR